MNKKRILLFVFVFFVTGCSANYTLDIGDDSYDEELELEVTDSSDQDDFDSFEDNIPINSDADEKKIFEEKIGGIEYYDFKRNSAGDKMLFSYTHTFDTLKKDYITVNSYKYVNISKDDDILILSTSKANLAFERYDNLDDLTIKVTSKYKLDETNADEVKGHTYIWYLNRENASDKYLYLALDTSTQDLSFWEKLLNGNYLNIFTLSVILLIGGYFGYKWLKKKSDLRDEV